MKFTEHLNDDEHFWWMSFEICQAVVARPFAGPQTEPLMSTATFTTIIRFTLGCSSFDLTSCYKYSKSCRAQVQVLAIKKTQKWYLRLSTKSLIYLIIPPYSEAASWALYYFNCSYAISNDCEYSLLCFYYCSREPYCSNAMFPYHSYCRRRIFKQSDSNYSVYKCNQETLIGTLSWKFKSIIF